MENQELKKVKRIAPYTRYGTMENIEGEMYQKQWLLDQYRDRNKNIEIKNLYVDVNKSAMSDRPEFNRLMEDIIEGKIDKVVVLGGISKLSRNCEEIEKIKEYVEIETVEPTIKVTNLNNNVENENFVRELSAIFSEYYRKDLSKRIKQGIALKKQKGKTI